MDRPSWNDTLRATLASCLPCSCAHHDEEHEEDNENDISDGARYAVRRARADELEGLLADADSGGDAAADTDAISLHSHLGPRGRRRPPPRTPRHIALWGFSLFGTHKHIALPDADDALHSRPPRRREDNNSTDRLLADAGAGPAPRELADADIERRARRRARKEMRRLARAAAQAYPSDGPPGLPQDDPDRRGIPAPFLFASPPPGLEAAGADALAHLRAQDDDDDADLDGGMYARLAPRSGPGGTGGSRSSGRSSNSGSNSNSNPTSNNYADANANAHVGPFVPPRTKSRSGKKGGKRSTKSGSSATSSTLASPSPPPYAAVPAFAHAPPHNEEEEFAEFASAPIRVATGPFSAPDDDEGFDGTPGGFGSRAHPAFEAGFGVDVEDEEEEEGGFDGAVAREALPSPGLSRGGSGSGFNFGAGRDRKGSAASAGAFLAGM
ncbi:hypothetical protein B0H11DRAFT_1905586 [Mycena galericulata]|nr:hypothetical protein B0H11DRAFT_1905586 [Mycena galericulata]